jgi:Flp pilus assembly protein TadG
MVELVLLMPVYATVFFGTLEFGQIFYDREELTEICREGVRRAAVGETTTQITTAMTNMATNPVRETLTSTQIYIEYNNAADGSGSWVSVTNNAGGTANTVPTGYLVRVRIPNWPHRMITGSLFATICGGSNSTLYINAYEVMMRQ